MVHGMMSGSLASWYFSIAPALARDHRVCMYDLRGHGLSELAPSGYDLRSMAADLHGVIGHFAGDEPVSLVGHSYGGIVALRYALDHPGRVQRLVIVDAPLPIMSASWVEKLSHATADSVLDMFPPGQRQALQGGRRSRRMIAQVIALTTMTTLLDDMMADPDIADRELAACDRPVLLCYGTQSAIVTQDTCARLAALLPNARVRMLDAGHYPQAEIPVLLAEVIGEFLHG
jgi:pimeloyl-ACP methyl ester carboxylesterase